MLKYGYGRLGDFDRDVCAVLEDLNLLLGDVDLSVSQLDQHLFDYDPEQNPGDHGHKKSQNLQPALLAFLA